MVGPQFGYVGDDADYFFLLLSIGSGKPFQNFVNCSVPVTLIPIYLEAPHKQNISLYQSRF
jgi:hypothetical protein